jgi:hypothetical protein
LIRALQVLDSFCDELDGVALESILNWYWLADGLHEAGYPTQLTNT